MEVNTLDQDENPNLIDNQLTIEATKLTMCQRSPS